MLMARNASGFASAYKSHRPEQTLLYQVIDKYYVDFLSCMEQQGRSLPRYVQREFEDYLKCGRLEHGFLRVQCDTCHAEHLARILHEGGRKMMDIYCYYNQLQQNIQS